MENYDVHCIVCLEAYGDDRLPRTLACGHSYCTSCIDQLIGNKNKRCPDCRKTFKAAKSANLSVNYSLMNLLRSVAAAAPAAQLNAAAAAEPNDGECGLHKALKFYYCEACSKFCCRDCLLLVHKEEPKGNCSTISYKEAIENMSAVEVKKADAKGDAMKLFLERISEDISKLDGERACSEADLEEHLSKADMERARLKTIQENKKQLEKTQKKVKNISVSLKQNMLDLQNVQTIEDVTTEAQISTKLIREFEDDDIQGVRSVLASLTVNEVCCLIPVDIFFLHILNYKQKSMPYL